MPFQANKREDEEEEKWKCHQSINGQEKKKGIVVLRNEKGWWWQSYSGDVFPTGLNLNSRPQSFSTLSDHVL
jgi:hypothetical protein